MAQRATNEIAEPLLEDLFHYLPEDYSERARKSGAFTRSRKIRSPMELMRMVLMYCGIDQVLREVAGNIIRANLSRLNQRRSRVFPV